MPLEVPYLPTALVNNHLRGVISKAPTWKHWVAMETFPTPRTQASHGIEVSLAARLCMCGEPSPNSFICHRCTSKLGKELRDVPQLMLALDDSLALLTKRGPWIGEFTKSGGGAQPLPVNLKAGELRDELHMRLQLTVRELTEERGLVYAGGDTTIALAHWLSLFRTTLALSDHAEDTFKDLMGTPPHSMGILGRCWKHVDRRPDMIFLGPCGTGDCWDDVYAVAGEDFGTCEGCTAVHDVPTRRRWLWSEIDDKLASMDVIILASSTIWGVVLKPNRFSVWKSRHQITPIPCADGIDRYRLSDITALMMIAEAEAGDKRRAHEAAQKRRATAA